ncbi:MAG: alanine--glyoxylate aminotransferase family protein [Thaumarchaeota archaeon]|nr:alanine--glyoxylate aminotransferase family protein [Nitrososphaerota archaeon]MCL5318976.1 alanine--glyoxylate aminotransferase family protein [Nitrososphaerota archaeon]
MNLRKLIMLPGPTNVPDRVMVAMLNPVMGHRTPEFGVLMKGILDKSKQVFQTSCDVIVLTASGTGGVEAAITNIVKQGDKAVVAVYGEFGERAADLVKGSGAEAIKVESHYGDTPKIDQLEEAFEKNPKAKALVIVANETSTGCSFKQLKQAGDLAAKYGAYFIIDAVSNLGGEDVPFDKIGADVVATGSQKCLAAPPGLAMVAISEKAKKYITANPPALLYYNIPRYLKYAKELQTPFTPALPLYHALDEGLNMVLEEGLQQRIKRHTMCADAFYSGFKAMGLELFAKEAARSNTVIAVNYPKGTDDKQFRGTLDRDHRVVVAGGFGEYKGKVFRVGSMGEVSRYHVLTTISAVNQTLKELSGQVNNKDPAEVAKAKLAGL